MALVGEERRLVEGRGSESFIVGVGRRAIRIPLFAKVCLALRLLVGLLLLPLPALFLFLVISIIGTICYEMTSLTALEAGALSLCFVLVRVLLTSFQCGLEVLYDYPNFLHFSSSSEKIHVWTLENFNVIFGPFARRHSLWRRANTARRHRL
jgi:hypothetical protein